MMMVGHFLRFFIFYVNQNIFEKKQRMMLLIIQYFFLFKSARNGVPTTSHLGQQIFKDCTKYFVESYRDATKGEYSYPLVDMRQET